MRGSEVTELLIWTTQTHAMTCILHIAQFADVNLEQHPICAHLGSTKPHVHVGYRSNSKDCWTLKVIATLFYGP